MANTFITTEEAGTKVASVALAALNRAVVLPNTVYRSAEADFSGGVGHTVTVKLPATLAARTLADRNQAITYDDVTETGVAVALDNLIYSGVRIPDESMELDIEDFMAQVAAPQIVACAIQAENVLADEFNTLVSELEIASGGADVLDIVTDARKALNEADVPFNNRFLAISPDVEAFLLKLDNLVKVDASGTDQALREATIGRIMGFEVVTSNALDAGTAVAYHRDAFAFVSRAPRVPMGAKVGASQSYGGLSVTWTMDYDPDYIWDRSLLRTIAGAALLDADRVVKITTAGLS